MKNRNLQKKFKFSGNQEAQTEEEDDADRFEEIDQQELQELQSEEETEELMPQLLFQSTIRTI